MVTIKIVNSNGDESTLECESGESLMQVAVNNDVPGIIGECGGNLACATCHVYVDEKWKDSLESIGEMEDAMLEGALDRNDNSRLACQIKINETLEGIRILLPASQV
jgi:ferredoxin, 2Fe-2S